jgi:DNA-directed RNA polymerase alpha subunit
MALEMKLVLKPDVITGFSYSFTKALLEKLKVLRDEKRIFEEVEYKQIEETAKLENRYSLTSIAGSVIGHLQGQLFGSNQGQELIEPKKVEELITTAEEFLESFFLQQRRKDLQDIPIQDTDFSVRLKNSLEPLHINSLGELLSWSEADLLKVRGFGKTCLREVKRKLREYGLYLKNDPEAVKEGLN